MYIYIYKIYVGIAIFHILHICNRVIALDGCRAGEGISEPLSDILYNMLSDELFKHPATQIESLVLSCR